MIIYANLQSNMSVSFRGEDFQRCNKHYNRKNGPDHIGASFHDVGVGFSNFGIGSLMPIYSQICPLVSEEKFFKE